MVYTSIEAYRVTRLAFGTASAQPITIAFWTAHHRTGLYSGIVRNSAANRNYAFTYTQNVADTWQYNVITIPGDTAGTWVSGTNANGLTIIFAVAAGSSMIALSANAWLGSGPYAAAPGQVNAIAATSDFFQLTGFILLPGIYAPTAARSPPYSCGCMIKGVICQRYYRKSYPDGINPGTASAPGPFVNFLNSLGVGLLAMHSPVYFGSPMRSAPSMTMFSPMSGASGKIYDNTNSADVPGGITAAGTSGFTWNATASAATSVINFWSHWVADARL